MPLAPPVLLMRLEKMERSGSFEMAVKRGAESLVSLSIGEEVARMVSKATGNTRLASILMS